MIYNTCPDFKRGLKFYVFCGYDRAGIYDADFWQKDITDLFERIAILAKYGAKPYIMRYERVYKTKYSGFYAAVAAWCNQPGIFVSFPFRLFCMCRGMSKKGYSKFKRDIEGYLISGEKTFYMARNGRCSARIPEIAKKYFDTDMKGAFDE
jgi:hypothetical protein